MTGPGSYQITCFALGACVHEILCAPTKTEVSIFPSPVGLLLLGPVGLAIFLVPDPWAGVGWETQSPATACTVALQGHFLSL